MIFKNDKIVIADITENKLLAVTDYFKTDDLGAQVVGGWSNDKKEIEVLEEKYAIRIDNNSLDFFSNYNTQNNPIVLIYITHIEKCEGMINELISYGNINIKSFIIATLPALPIKAAILKNLCQKLNADVNFIALASKQAYAILDTDDIVWTNQELDIDLRNELTERNISSGKLLDLGAGLCTQSYNLMKMGFDVAASDISPYAIEIAESKYKDVGIKFYVDDIVETKLTEEFDYIFDRGCFHCLHIDDQKKYIESVHKILKNNGILFLKTFKTGVKLEQGSPTLSRKIDIINNFDAGFKIDKIYDCFFTDNTGHKNKAIFAVIRCVK